MSFDWRNRQGNLGDHKHLTTDVLDEETGAPTGGGTAAVTGFQVYLSAPWAADGGPVPYDEAAFDTDGFWDTNEATIPVGKGGLYQVSVFTYIADEDDLTVITGIVPCGSLDTWENDLDEYFVKRSKGTNSPDWSEGTSWVSRYAEGDTISFTIGWYPFTVPSLQIGSASYLAAIRLGDLP